jgi:thiosulfate reductase cytochrome b subunit
MKRQESINQPFTKSTVLLRIMVRACAWALLVLIIVMVVSGWGITQTSIIYNLSFGLINRGVANSIHRALNVPLAIFFITHVFINIKLAALKRFSSLQWLVSSVLIVLGIALMTIMVYMEYFRLGG